MLRQTAMALLLLAVAADGAAGQDWARKMFKTTTHDFGTVARGAKAEFVFELTNLYEEEVHIASVRSSCGCATPTITQPTLKTWEKSAIVTAFNTRSFLGHKNSTITVTIDRPFFAEVQLEVEGFIRGDVVFEPGAVELGEVDEGDSVTRNVRLTYAGRPDWQIVDVRSANSNLEVELAEASRAAGRVVYDMTVRLKPETSAGFVNSELVIVTNDADSKTISLAVQGRVTPALNVSPAPLFMGVVAPGKTVTKQLVVRAKEPFEILDIKCPDGSFEFQPSGGAKKLHFIPVTFHAGEKAGKVAQTIEITTDLKSGGVAKCLATATVVQP